MIQKDTSAFNAITGPYIIIGVFADGGDVEDLSKFWLREKLEYTGTNNKDGSWSAPKPFVFSTILREGHSMRIRFSFTVLLMLVTCCAFVPAGSTSTVPSLGQVRCSITPQNSSYTLGEPILATLKITNDSDAPAKVYLGFNQEGAIRFTIKKPSGVSFTAPQIPGRDGLSKLSNVTIKPNETFSKRLILNRWYGFRQTGVYDIRWSLMPLPQNSAANVCDDETIYIEIAPYNMERLREVSEELVAIISNEDQNNARAVEAAKALITIKDPLVVKYLSLAHTANSAVDDILIGGLETVGDQSAAEVLIRIFNAARPDSSTFVQARAALESIAKKEQNPELVDRIRNAIKSNLQRREEAAQKNSQGF